MAGREGWGADDSLIVCVCWQHIAPSALLDPDAKQTLCELCKGAICAYPWSMERAHEPGWHLICTTCFVEIAAQEEADVKGRYPAPWEN